LSVRRRGRSVLAGGEAGAPSSVGGGGSVRLVGNVVPGVVEPLLAVTFDDGPSRWTGEVLSVLAAFGARATFFMIGEAVIGMPEVAAAVVAAGHEVGNHTFTHVRLDERRSARVERELRRTSDVLAERVGVRPSLFRPPYVGYDKRVLAAASRVGLGQAVVADAYPEDYALDSAREIADRALAVACPGRVICLHDGRPPREPTGITRQSRWPTVAALELILAELQGFRFVTVSELLRQARCDV
jgi:peptidoglycan/xylan/chitin deacetylase (PgdA/CDA1 family)